MLYTTIAATIVLFTSLNFWVRFKIPKKINWFDFVASIVIVTVLVILVRPIG